MGNNGLRTVKTWAIEDTCQSRCLQDLHDEVLDPGLGNGKYSNCLMIEQELDIAESVALGCRHKL